MPRLKKVVVTGFRSINDQTTLFLEDNVTVLLGANDHGKTNLLVALTRLNLDDDLEDEDRNWDLPSDGSPEIVGEFLLTDDDRSALANLENEARLAAANGGEPSEGDQKVPPSLRGSDLPSEFTVTRRANGLRYNTVAGLSSAAATSFIKDNLPSFQLIAPVEKIPDAATAETIVDDSHEFMQGIFFYAGLNEDEWPTLFEQDDVTARRLADASVALNDTLKKNWSQGRELEFKLEHDSKAAEIVLRIKDPAVRRRFVRASHRSSGFTNFFAIKTILHARQTKNGAEAYVWLFDEPGLFLHPAGQHDLLQVIETLGAANQVVYTTHSIFLANKNDPQRHRLVTKSATGTSVNGKPYIGGWHGALEALGLSLPGTVLFAPSVLLVEGDSDPILLFGVLQWLLARGKVDMDLNQLGIMATGELRHADALFRILLEANPAPRVAVLVDGDKGGANRIAGLKLLLDGSGSPYKVLSSGTTTEDHLPLFDPLYIKAACDYAAEVAGLTDGGRQKLFTAATKAYSDQFQGAAPSGAAEWLLDVVQASTKMPNQLSKVGVARRYVEELRGRDEKAKVAEYRRARDLVTWIGDALKLPSRTLPQDTIVDETHGDEA